MTANAPVVLETIGPGAPSTSEFRTACRGWLDEKSDELEPFRHLPEGLDDQFAVLGALQRLLYDAGWLRWGWPEAVGGLGGTALLRGVLSEELVEVGCPPPFSFGVMEVLGPPVAHFAPALAAQVLPGLLRGDECWCQGFSEPEAGSDLASLRLRAVADGDGWVLTGQKVWTSWAQYADRCVVLARTGTQDDGHRGITAFLVDMSSPGITVRPLRAMSGDAEFAELFFDGVVVPGSRVVGEIGAGWAVAMYVLACERGAVAWQRQAWMHRRLADLARSAGNRPDGVAAVGDTLALLYGLRLASRRTLRRLAAGELPGADASVDKILLCTAEQALFDAAVDLLPGTLLVEDTDEARRWRGEYLYSRAASIYGGTAEIQRTLVAERLLGLPRGR